MLRWLMLAGALSASALHAEVVTLEVAPDLIAQAYYAPGAAAKPALLLLHGFLQTYDFPTIHNLGESLSGAGFTVLAPNLSLNITHRQQSLACEAFHTHTVQQDTQEIGLWVRWLKQRHPGSIVLAGHSLGGLIALAYLMDKPDPAVKRFIGISVIESHIPPDTQILAQRLQALRQQVQRGEDALITQPLSFCQKYQATPTSLLSYLEWTPERVLATTVQSVVPITLIMGGDDERLGPNWISKLQARPAKTIIIPEANHFMDGEKEFALSDAVISELEQVDAARP